MWSYRLCYMLPFHMQYIVKIPLCPQSCIIILKCKICYLLKKIIRLLKVDQDIPLCWSNSDVVSSLILPSVDLYVDCMKYFHSLVNINLFFLNDANFVCPVRGTLYRLQNALHWFIFHALIYFSLKSFFHHIPRFSFTLSLNHFHHYWSVKLWSLNLET